MAVRLLGHSLESEEPAVKKLSRWWKAGTEQSKNQKASKCLRRTCFPNIFQSFGLIRIRQNALFMVNPNY